jgi:hypothetical protein
LSFSKVVTPSQVDMVLDMVDRDMTTANTAGFNTPTRGKKWAITSLQVIGLSSDDVLGYPNFGVGVTDGY